jgi:two-component system alkaline phosphatase synthesis response regulator PhoP
MQKMANGKKVLIVEDEANLLDVLRDELAAAGFEIFKAHDGEEGYKLALEKHPDLILIDVLMPKMDGITMFKNIRKHEALKSIPGIILTNLSDTKTVEDALESGAYDFLVKSDWEPKNLVKRVQEKLGLADKK